jgi:uncharacterized protein (TIGR04222 family)
MMCTIALPVHTGAVIWGISGPRFLAAYAALAATALLIGLLSRRWVGSRGDGREPGVVELAYLNDRARLACQVCIAGLRRAGAVECADLTTLVASGPLSAGSSLARALHASLRQPRTWSVLLAEPKIHEELRRLERQLVGRGWLLSAAQRRRIKLGVVPLMAVAAFGATRLVAAAVGTGSAGAAGSVVGLVLACAATLLAGWHLLEVPEVGRLGRRLLRHARASTSTFRRIASRTGVSAVSGS